MSELEAHRRRLYSAAQRLKYALPRSWQ